MKKQKFNNRQEILTQDLENINIFTEDAFKNLITDLLLANNAAVTGLQVKAQATPDMTVYVDTGRIWQNGYLGEQLTASDAQTVSIAPTGVNKRIDRIVAKYAEVEDMPQVRNVMVDVNTRQVSQQSVNTRKMGIISLQYVQGTAAANPMAPAVPIGYVSLARITVNAGVSIIQQTDISDERPLLSSLLSHAHKGGNDGVRLDFNQLLNTPNMANYLPLSGGTMNGSLLLAADPVTNMEAATKRYADENGGINLWRPSNTYAVGDICYSKNAASYKRFECVVAGTTGTVEPTWTAVGALVTDGTVTWIIDDVRDGTPVGRPVFDMLVRPGYVELAGAIYSRSAYPRLWKFATDNNLTVSEADWAAGTYGLFSIGDGNTTFRVPKNAGEFIRALDTLQSLDKSNIIGNTTSGSVTISNLASTVTLAVGMAVSGSGIPTGATIASIVSSTSITISANATTTASGVTLTVTGRKMGSMQVDTFKSHYHIAGHTSSGTYGNSGGSNISLLYGSPTPADTVTTSTGDLETRGHNIAYYGAIKY